MCMRNKKFTRMYLASSALALVSLTAGCSSENGSASEKTTETAETTETTETTNSLIDEKIMASVECVVTELKTQDVLGMEELGNSKALITLKADSYFYYDQKVTVTNYSDDAKDIYLEHRLVDANGIVFDSANFLETINAGETITLTDNRIQNSSRDLVFYADSTLGKTWFDCPVTKVSL